jgi:6-phosphogluconolactonase
MQYISRRTFLGCGAVMLAVRPSRAQVSQLRAFIGTYTNASGENIPSDFGQRTTISRGIYTFTFDPTTGRAGDVNLAAEIGGPVNVILHPNGRFIYACAGQRELAAFAIEGAQLRAINRVASGSGPSHGQVDSTGRNLLTVHWSGHNIVCYRLNEDGSIGERTALIGKPSEQQGARPGAGPGAGQTASPARQGPGLGEKVSAAEVAAGRTKPHAVILSRTQQYALVAEIDANRCTVLRFDAEKGSLTPHSMASAYDNSGPRHLNFEPTYRYLYTADEAGSSITAWQWNEEKGELKAFQKLTTLPDGFTGTNHPADVEVHPSGRFVYVSNRGAGTLAGFAIDQTNGSLKPIGHAALGSLSSWCFEFDPSGKWALVTAIIGDSIVIYSVDQKTGKLTATGQKISVALPSCLRIVK